MTETINTIPVAGSTFLEVLQAFLRREDAQRFAAQFRSFVVEGGIHGLVAGLTATPSAMTAFPGGYYTTETGSITYADASITFVIASAVDTGDLGGYTRVPGTHYLISVAVSEPATPNDCVRLMTVTTAGGSVTNVTDKRELSPLYNRTLVPYVRLNGTEPGASDLRVAESTGRLVIEENTGTEDSPSWAIRFAFTPSNFRLNLNSGVTAERSQTFQDKDGIIATLDDISGSAFAAGTRMLFDNDVAPTGWVRDVGINDVVVRIVSGARADGGSWTVSGLTASGHALTIAEMPAHTHPAPGGAAFSTTDPLATQVSGAGPGGTAAATDTTGGGAQHTHNVASNATWRPLHRDMILCQKT